WYRERGTTHALFFDFGTTERVTRVEGDPFVRVPVPQVTPSPVPAPRAVRPPPPLPPVEGPLPPGEKRLGDPPARHPIPEPRFSPPLPPPPATGLDGAVRFDAERRAPARRLLVRLHDPAASDLAATRCPD
ncbi:MAG TPA: hypothetical protein VFR34_09705, partial [Paracoccaceae bacterium]|nr:hypothetical protein [Paracoccaceae bacterium]